MRMRCANGIVAIVDADVSDGEAADWVSWWIVRHRSGM